METENFKTISAEFNTKALNSCKGTIAYQKAETRKIAYSASCTMQPYGRLVYANIVYAISPGSSATNTERIQLGTENGWRKSYRVRNPVSYVDSTDNKEEPIQNCACSCDTDRATQDALDECNESTRTALRAYKDLCAQRYALYIGVTVPAAIQAAVIYAQRAENQANSNSPIEPSGRQYTQEFATALARGRYGSRFVSCSLEQGRWTQVPGQTRRCSSLEQIPGPANLEPIVFKCGEFLAEGAGGCDNGSSTQVTAIGYTNLTKMSAGTGDNQKCDDDNSSTNAQTIDYKNLFV